MRLTMHNGRRNRGKAFSRVHNDRNFYISKAAHIDQERSQDNKYWHCYIDSHPKMTFEEAERKFYEDHFRQSLDNQNAKYEKNRHIERCITMDQFMEGRGCPEEFILQVGKKGETVPPQDLWQMALDYMHWLHTEFPNVQMLDMALHTDERGAAHVQGRLTWYGKDKDGFLTVGQNKALKEMGIVRPHPDKIESKINNAKVTYTSVCRNHLLEMCKERGFEIELVPKETSKSGLSLIEYQAQQELEKAETARQEIDTAEKRLSELSEKIKVEEIKGTEREYLQALEKSAKERPITKGIIKKEVIGYEVSPTFINEAMRMARLGCQAAEERQRANEAEREAESARKRESAAKAELEQKTIRMQEQINQITAELIKTEEIASAWLDAPRAEQDLALKNAQEYGDDVNRCIVAFAIADKRTRDNNTYDTANVASALSEIIGYVCGSNNTKDKQEYVAEVIKAYKAQAKKVARAIKKGEPLPVPPSRPSGGRWFPPPRCTDFSVPVSISLLKSLIDPGYVYLLPYYNNAPDFDLMSEEEIKEYFLYRDDY